LSSQALGFDSRIFQGIVNGIHSMHIFLRASHIKDRLYSGSTGWKAEGGRQDTRKQSRNNEAECQACQVNGNRHRLCFNKKKKPEQGFSWDDKELLMESKGKLKNQDLGGLKLE
jgi:hypothetical protein